METCTVELTSMMNAILVKRVEFRDAFECKFFLDAARCDTAFALIKLQVQCVIKRANHAGTEGDGGAGRRGTGAEGVEHEAAQGEEDVARDSFTPKYHLIVRGVSFQVF